MRCGGQIGKVVLKIATRSTAQTLRQGHEPMGESTQMHRETLSASNTSFAPWRTGACFLDTSFKCNQAPVSCGRMRRDFALRGLPGTVMGPSRRRSAGVGRASFAVNHD